MFGGESLSENIQIINDWLLVKKNEGNSSYDSEQAKSPRDSKRQQERAKRPTVLKAKTFWAIEPKRGKSI